MNWAFEIALKNRMILKSFVETYSLEELNTQPKGFYNTIIWNIAHTIATQQILVYRLSGLSTPVSETFIDTYKKGTKTERNLTQEEVDEIKEMLCSTIEKMKADYESGIFKTYETYTVSTKSTLTKVEEAIDFLNFHEGIHLGYILALKKSI